MCQDDKICVVLDFKRETPTTVIAVDETGTERWLDKSKLTVVVVGDKVEVNTTAHEWKGRVSKNTSQYQSPLREARKDMRTRKCMMCKQVKELEKCMFVCDNCKNTSDWKNANSTMGGIY